MLRPYVIIVHEGLAAREEPFPSRWESSPKATLRTGRATFTASGSPVSLQSGSV